MGCTGGYKKIVVFEARRHVKMSIMGPRVFHYNFFDLHCESVPMPDCIRFEPPPAKAVNTSTEVEFLKELYTPTNTLSDILFLGIKTPQMESNDLLYQDLSVILRTICRAGCDADYNTLDTMLNEWFPQGQYCIPNPILTMLILTSRVVWAGHGARRYDVSFVATAKSIFVEYFCPRFIDSYRSLATKQKNGHLKGHVDKCTHLWDTAISLLIAGPTRHYMKKSFLNSVSDGFFYIVDGKYVSYVKPSPIAPFMIMPILMCISFSFNAIEYSLGQCDNGTRLEMGACNGGSQYMDETVAWFITALEEIRSQRCEVSSDISNVMSSIVRKWVIASNIPTP
jgi:hypothetical protein